MLAVLEEAIAQFHDTRFSDTRAATLVEEVEAWAFGAEDCRLAILIRKSLRGPRPRG